MGTAMTGAALRRRRLDAGLSQRELAARSGIPQPSIAAYESGRRMPADSTQERLDAVLRIPTIERLRAVRAPILAAAASRGLSEVRVFGSVARGTAGSESDVDLLVHPASHASVFDLAGFMVDVEELLGIRVDVVSDRGHGPTMERIRAEAVTL
jgi:predicted nucleotidyltransferase